MKQITERVKLLNEKGEKQKCEICDVLDADVQTDDA